MKNLNTILPWYDTKAEQYRWREDVDNDCMVICNPSTIVPWIIRRAHNTGTVANLIWRTYFKSNDGELVNDSFASWITASVELTIVTGTSYDYIVFDGHALASALPKGLFYFKLTDSADSKDYYSETINVRDTSVVTENGNPVFVRLQFSNDTQLSNILAAFVQWVYLDTNLKAPEWLREDTGDKRDGLMVFEKRVIAKVDVMHLSAVNEYMCDALMLLPMMDNVSVYIDSVCYTWDEVQIKDPEWLDPLKGSMAKMEIRFVGDVVIKKLNFKEMGCNCSDNTGGSGMLKNGHGIGVEATGTGATFTGTPFADTNYYLSILAIDALGNRVDCPVVLKATTLFTFTPAANCTYTWMAVSS